MVRTELRVLREALHRASQFHWCPPGGYVSHDQGKQLTEYIRRKPYSIVLIDEVEKVSREFYTLFLQVLDDGRLTDGQGRIGDFCNKIIIRQGSSSGAIRNRFPLEFINWIDEIVILHTLSRANVLEVVHIRLKQVQDRLMDRKMTLEFDDTAKNYLMPIGCSPAWTARSRKSCSVRSRS
ncbi:Chaperone protein ClpB [Trametes pubescens]|uniref:Chaperone protein ClpB n=2 Tax=Trametes pubescens TaxID=154538 RepID=A0A1M2V2X5_TRAPU|nr:Chaperone protein ClpB [Trametes pubescens]